MTSIEFKKLYTQFSDVPDESVNSRLQDFFCFYGDYNWGKARDKAQGLFVAHVLTLYNAETVDKDNIDQALSSRGLPTTERTPEYQVSYSLTEFLSKGDGEDGWLKQTLYGQEFLILLRRKKTIAVLV